MITLVQSTNQDVAQAADLAGILDDRVRVTHHDQISPLGQEVIDMARTQSQMLDIKRRQEALFKQLTESLARHIKAAQELQITLANRPMVTANLHRLTLDTEPVLRQARMVIEAECAMLRG